MTSLQTKNIVVLGRKTSIRLEPDMWRALYEVAEREQCTIHDICNLVSLRKSSMASLTAAIRTFLMLYYRSSSTEEGHKKANHGSFEYMKRRARVDDMMLAESAH